MEIDFKLNLKSSVIEATIVRLKFVQIIFGFNIFIVHCWQQSTSKEKHQLNQKSYRMQYLVYWMKLCKLPLWNYIQSSNKKEHVRIARGFDNRFIHYVTLSEQKWTLLLSASSTFKQNNNLILSFIVHRHNLWTDTEYWFCSIVPILHSINPIRVHIAEETKFDMVCQRMLG